MERQIVRMRRAHKFCTSKMGGTTTITAVAIRQFNEKMMHSVTTSRSVDSTGESNACCNRPVVLSTSLDSRDKMPPVFISVSSAIGSRKMR
jgi:hypothetical protein